MESELSVLQYDVKRMSFCPVTRAFLFVGPGNPFHAGK